MADLNLLQWLISEEGKDFIRTRGCGCVIAFLVFVLVSSLIWALFFR